MHSLLTIRIRRQMVDHLSSRLNTAISNRRNRQCIASKAICNDVQCSLTISVTNNIRFKIIADKVACRMDKWLVDRLVSNNRINKECPRYNMTITSHRKVTQGICSLLDLASKIFALRILDQMALFIKGIKEENHLLQIETLITHNVTLKRHVEVFIF